MPDPTVMTTETRQSLPSALPKDYVKTLADRIMAPADPLSSHLPASPDDCRILIAACNIEEAKLSPEDAALLAGYVIGAYRRTDYADPEVWVARVTRLFARFPASIAKRVADEYPDTHKFPPTVAEIQDALTAALARRRAVVDRARRVLAEHERREREAKRFTKPPRDVREKIVASAKLFGACRHPPQATRNDAR